MESVREIELAERLGVDRGILRKMRAGRAEGDGWERVGLEIHWTQEGAEKVAAELAGQTVNGALHGPALDEERVVYVVASHFPNRRVIACVEDPETVGDRTHWIIVRVRNASKFLTGTVTGKILVRWNGRHWSFAGRPGNENNQPHEPRWKGKW